MTDAPAAPTAPAPVDWTDPCARAAALTAAYYTLLSGSAEIEIRTRTNEVEEAVKFQPAKLETLRAEMSDAQAECEAKQAGRLLGPRRFAIACRHKRPRCEPYSHARRYP